MGNRHGEFRDEGFERGRGRYGEEREPSRMRSWDTDRDDERRRSESWGREAGDSPEVMAWGRDVSEDYRRQGGGWEERGSRAGSRSGLEGSYGRGGYGRTGRDYGSYDEGRVQYGPRRDRDDEEDDGGSRLGRWARRTFGLESEGRGDYGSERGRYGGFGQEGFGRTYSEGSYGRGGYGQSGYGQGGYGTGGYGQGGFTQGGYGSGSYAGGELGPRPYGQSPESSYAAGSYSQSQGYAGMPTRGFRGRGPKNYERSDERLREIVCEMLLEDDEIDASDITVTVASGTVTLDGTVPDRRMKYLTEERVERVIGVKDVRNNLRVTSNRGEMSTEQRGLQGNSEKETSARKS